MSLKRIIEKDQDFKELFKRIPNLKKHFKSIDGKDAFNKEGIICMPVPRSSPQDVGTAYDFWIRAYIQRINGQIKELTIPDVVSGGIKGMWDLKIFDKKDIKKIASEAKKAWNLRKEFILGKEIELEVFAKSLLLLAYIEDFFRARGRIEAGLQQSRSLDSYLYISKEDITNLVNLMQQKEKIENYFKANNLDELFLNPTFGETSKFIEGADGDLIIDGVLIDFKTDKEIIYKTKYIYQIIGYYILSMEDRIIGYSSMSTKKLEPYKINRIGFYFARFNRLIYIEIEELKEIMKMNGYTLNQLINDFRDLAKKKYTTNSFLM